MPICQFGGHTLYGIFATLLIRHFQPLSAMILSAFISYWLSLRAIISLLFYADTLAIAA
jgi:hypothetical protein